MAIGKPVKDETVGMTTETKTLTVRRVENNTSCILTLPCTDSFPLGVRLIPGLNSVPVKYLDELENFELDGVKVKRAGKEVQLDPTYPGRAALALLQQPVRIVRASGETHGPQITIYEPGDKADLPDGPPAPTMLPQNKDAAMAIVRATKDRAALKRWSEQGNGEVNQAAGAALNALVFTPSQASG